MKGRLSKISLFWKLWICHILLYFFLLTLFLIIRDNKADDGIFSNDILLKLLRSPIIGLFGILDGIGVFVIISMVVMYLIDLYIQKFYISYILSLALTYPVFMQFCNEGYGANIITVIVLSITIIINMVIFRKHIINMYKSLSTLFYAWFNAIFTLIFRNNSS
ncbi:hypothetical protein [Chryseobacterium aurantiacum]|uniref:hypothetical protein n=1 Tax=Chryseobacterium aurantiacum TaxID=2116499 RepID=UPI000D11EC84|nr:hypothetical protein [Chryseobacterium aurantiacum]